MSLRSVFLHSDIGGNLNLQLILRHAIGVGVNDDPIIAGFGQFS